MNEPLNHIKHHQISDALLREFISKELWLPALMSCDEAIAKREGDIKALRELKRKIDNEL